MASKSTRSAKSLYEKALKSQKRLGKRDESIIMKDPQYIYKYAKNVIKERWPEAESNLFRDVEYTYKYVKEFGLNLYDLNINIKYFTYNLPQNPTAKSVYEWARKHRREVPQKYEKFLKTDPHYMYMYARHISKRRWPKRDEKLMLDMVQKDINTSTSRKDILIKYKTMEKWLGEEIEDLIRYARFVVKERWPELEEFLVDNKIKYNIIDYAYYMVHDKRWYKAEKYINGTLDSVTYWHRFNIFKI